MADSNNKKANKLQTVKKIETAEEKSASKPVRCPKYEKDLEKGKTHICQIPFKYRDAWAYARAMKYINTRKDIEKKIEKEVVRIQLLNDIAESKRAGDAEREADLMAAYEVCFVCGDFDYILSTLIQKQRDWRQKKRNRRTRGLKVFGQSLQYIAKYGMLTLTAELGLIDRYRAGRKDLLFLFPKIPHTKYKSKKKGVKEMTKTANEEWEIPGRQKVVRGSYSVNALACVSMLDKYYDIRKDGKIVDTVILKEPYTVIGSHAFTNCHVKELTIPDTVTQLNCFAFADSKTLKKITLGKGIEKCGEDLILMSDIKEVVWTRPIGVSVDSGFYSMLYGMIREESLLVCSPYLISLKRAQFFLKTGEPQKTFLLTYNGKSVRLPKYINNYINMVAVVDMVHNVLASKTDCQGLTYRLILDAMSDFQNKVSVALELYILEGSLDAKKYLQKESAKISETIAKRGDDDALSKFISLGLMDEETIKKTMQITMERKLQISTAYLLDEMRKCGLAVPDSLNL